MAEVEEDCWRDWVCCRAARFELVVVGFCARIGVVRAVERLRKARLEAIILGDALEGGGVERETVAAVCVRQWPL